ncbi:hypothetical protein D3C73_1576870 [compost metagenome]
MRLPLKTFFLLAIVAIPSRPKLISLSMTLPPGAFHTDMPLPNSLIRPSLRPTITFFRASESLAPWR